MGKGNCPPYSVWTEGLGGGLEGKGGDKHRICVKMNTKVVLASYLLADFLLCLIACYSLVLSLSLCLCVHSLEYLLIHKVYNYTRNVTRTVHILVSSYLYIGCIQLIERKYEVEIMIITYMCLVSIAFLYRFPKRLQTAEVAGMLGVDVRNGVTGKQSALLRLGSGSNHPFPIIASIRGNDYV